MVFDSCLQRQTFGAQCAVKALDAARVGLFLNKVGSDPAQKRMIQVALDRTLSKAEIQKNVTVHTLRASFATHLLKDSVDIFTVNRLMGDGCLRSLSSYMGVTKFEASLKSLLDGLPKKRGRKPKSTLRDNSFVYSLNAHKYVAVKRESGLAIL